MYSVRAYLFTVLCLVAGAALYAMPSMEPLFAAAQKSAYTPRELFEVALRFSECTEGSAAWNSACAGFDSLAAQVATSEYRSLPEEERAERLMSLIYQDTLRQYREKQSRADVLFSEGTYNCVSSSVLYMLLAHAAGLDVRPQRTATHAFCTLYTSGGKKIDVETTNPYGFNPGTRQQLSSNRYYIVPKSNYSGRKEVSAEMLVSLIGRNLAVLYEKGGRYADAVPISAARYVFMQAEPESGGNDSRKDFDQSCLNYAADLQRKKQFEPAADWLVAVIARWGTSPLLQKNMDSAAGNVVGDYCNARDIPGAEQAYQKYAPVVSQQQQQLFRNMIFMSDSDLRVRNSPPDEALAYLAQALQDPAAADAKSQKQLKAWQEYCWIKKISVAAETDGYLAAEAVAVQAEQALPQSAAVRKARAQNLHNHDASFHNRFAAAANARNFAEAEQILRQGLAENPGSTILQNDLKTLQKRMGTR